MLFCNVGLQFPAFFHWQQCPFTAYCVWDSPNIAHNVNKLSAFCHCTGWPISYCSLIHLPHQSVCACGVTLHTVKLECGLWQLSITVCASHGQWHTTSTYKSTQSVGGCTVPSCLPCTGVPFISHLPYWERGHWKTSNANIVINGYHECRWG